MSLLAFNNLTYQLGNGGERKITVSASLKEGEILVVRGPSGAGKSTLLRVLAKLQPGESGEVFLAGENWQTIPSTHWRSQVHYLAQKPAIFEGTVLDNLTKPFELRLVKKKLSFNLDLAKRLMQDLLLSPDLLNHDARTLSGGEAARLAFVRSLITEPTVLLLDEPTAALDNLSRAAFNRTLSKWLLGSHRAAVLVSHNNDVDSLARVSFLDIV
ncbi:ABC transporter related protein [Desulfotomaculum nigrificans CO-1-SRB]|uniref:ABC transporter related protein n=1 Tax=Desulfotomaculum nigrificans (strain DSM 14880 / VKM B-2319 / CO-1-SRB) TaxID=868595 RepID=F6B6Y9_DESCC|nr:ATP-binding cassette domain-containing protein [Desulfotomaculum nigrificans]AEF93314.1 ABC transporter related protein [Desulfotomaculum nigrificans CO-1-SRB]